MAHYTQEGCDSEDDDFPVPLSDNEINGFRCTYPGCNSIIKYRKHFKDHFRSHTGEVSLATYYTLVRFRLINHLDLLLIYFSLHKIFLHLWLYSYFYRYDTVMYLPECIEMDFVALTNVWIDNSILEAIPM